MTEKYTAHEVVEQVSGLNSISTFNHWVNFIQKKCNYTFQVEMIPFQSYRARQPVINHKESRVYSAEEIKKFQQVPSLIQQVGREQALRQLFDREYQFEQLSHYELLERLEHYFDRNFNKKFEAQEEKVQRFQHQLSTLYSEIHSLRDQIEKANEDKGKSGSGWFRRKR